MLYVESRKTVQMHLFPKQKYRCRHREQMYGHQGRIWEGGINSEIDIYTVYFYISISIYILIYILLCIK